MENEEYSVKENDALEEYQAYSEFNAESTVSEFLSTLTSISISHP